MLQRKGILLLLVLAVGLALATWGWTARGLQASEASLAVFNVDKMTCGSCVSNIQRALKELDGVGAVEVSVTAGRSQVEYDRQRVEAETIAGVITAAGYPATLRETLSAEEYRALKAEEGQLANRYVARIGQRLLPRTEFEAALEQARAELPQPPAPQALNQLRQQVWSRFLQQELLLNAAEQSQVVVQESEIAAEIERIKAGHAGFDQLLVERFGSLEAFSRQLKNDMIISKHLTENVSDPGLSAAQQQLQLQNWYQQLVKTTPLVIFDPALKAANSGSGSGCGGSCCG